MAVLQCVRTYRCAAARRRACEAGSSGSSGSSAAAAESAAAALPLPVLTNILVSYLSPDAHRRRATSSSDKAIKILNYVALGPTLAS